MQERGDYNLDRFGEGFRNRLYSDRGRELLRSQASQAAQQQSERDR